MKALSIERANELVSGMKRMSLFMIYSFFADGMWDKKSCFVYERHDCLIEFALNVRLSNHFCDGLLRGERSPRPEGQGECPEDIHPRQLS